MYAPTEVPTFARLMDSFNPDGPYRRQARIVAISMHLALSYYTERAVEYLTSTFVDGSHLGASLCTRYPAVHGEIIRAWSDGLITHDVLIHLTSGSEVVELINKSDSMLVLAGVLVIMSKLAEEQPNTAALLFCRVRAWMDTVDKAGDILGNELDRIRGDIMRNSDHQEYVCNLVCG
jgi:hypothetical protein